MQPPLIPANAPIEQGEYGANRKVVLQAISKCPDEYTVLDIEKALIELGTEIPRAAISQAVSRLAKRNEIKVLHKGAGRKAAIFKK